MFEAWECFGESFSWKEFCSRGFTEEPLIKKFVWCRIVRGDKTEGGSHTGVAQMPSSSGRKFHLRGSLS